MACHRGASIRGKGDCVEGSAVNSDHHSNDGGLIMINHRLGRVVMANTLTRPGWPCGSSRMTSEQSCGQLQIRSDAPEWLGTQRVKPQMSQVNWVWRIGWALKMAPKYQGVSQYIPVPFDQHILEFQQPELGLRLRCVFCQKNGRSSKPPKLLETLSANHLWSIAINSNHQKGKTIERCSGHIHFLRIFFWDVSEVSMPCKENHRNLPLVSAAGCRGVNAADGLCWGSCRQSQAVPFWIVGQIWTNLDPGYPIVDPGWSHVWCLDGGAVASAPPAQCWVALRASGCPRRWSDGRCIGARGGEEPMETRGTNEVNQGLYVEIWDLMGFEIDLLVFLCNLILWVGQLYSGWV